METTLHKTNTVESKSDQKIIDEIRILRERVFAMYGVIRYKQERIKGEHASESVAEHIFSSIFLAELFLQLEGLEDKVDYKKIIRMLISHDLHEGITGDVLEAEQGDHLEAGELPAISLISREFPLNIGDLAQMYKDKEKGLSLEGKFVQAIDKFQPLLWFFTDENIQMIRAINSREEIISNQEKRNNLFKDFPIMLAYSKVIFEDLVRRGLLD